MMPHLSLIITILEIIILQRVVLLDLLIMSAVFKLFYIRGHRKYVEHFIYNLNVRSLLFFIGIILILLPVISQSWILLTIFLAILLFLIKSQKNVYKQSLFKTVIKFLLLIAINLIVLLLALLLVVFISSLLF